MRLVEELCLPKGNNLRPNEDGVFFNNHYAAVVDGCSSAQPLPFTDRRSGAIARDLLVIALKGLDPKATCQEAFAALNEAIVRWYKKEKSVTYFHERPHRRPSAYVAIASAYRREVWVLGDCQALVNGVLYTHHKRIDTLMEDLRALFIEAALVNGVSIDELLENPQIINDQLRPIMANQPLFQNAEDGSSYAYQVLDGFFVDYESVQCIPLGDEPTEVVLATDGYPVLAPSLQESESELAILLLEDPLCYKTIRSTKGVEGTNNSYDDRSYLRLIV
ncbi:MAG: hypothetical protein WC233_08760 [Sphaerochaeta sp.]